MTDEELFLKLDQQVEIVTTGQYVTAVKFDGKLYFVSNQTGQVTTEEGTCSELGQAVLGRWVLGKLKNLE